MNKNVIVFSTPTCGWCAKLKSYLHRHQIPFKDLDVSRDPKAAQDMMQRTGRMGVPQIWIDNQPVVGFDKNTLNQLLDIREDNDD